MSGTPSENFYIKQNIYMYVWNGVWLRAQSEWRDVSDDGEPNVLSEASRSTELCCEQKHQHS